MSLQFGEVPHLDHEAAPGSSSSTSDNVDILDEFLDRRLYEDQSYVKGQQPQQQQQQQQDEEMFDNFMVDDLNGNDFFFNPASQDQALESFELKPNDQYLLGSKQFVPPPATTPTSIDVSPGSTFQQEVFTTPTSFPPEATSSMGSVSMASVLPLQQLDSPYEATRELLSQLKFGREAPAQFSNEFPRHFLDVDHSTLPFQMTVQNLPAFSRVETQIKLQLSVSPPPPQFLVHLPADTIAKQKLCLSSDVTPEVREKMLFLDTYVLTSSDKPCNICTRCVRREQKRASRRKSGVSDNMNWMTNSHKRAIIFNCKEVISFPATTQKDSKSVELSSRIVCYCRHHNEPTGFKLLFVLTNSTGAIVAKHVSSPIMIMDRKKNSDETSNAGQLSNTTSNSANEGSIMSSRRNTQPISPTSIEDDSSEPQTSDYRTFKRKKTWSPELSDGFSIAPSRKPSGPIIKREPGIQPSHSSVDISSQAPQFQISQSVSQVLQQQQLQQLPVIQRVIPSQGPLRGGIEVTLLGSNFKDGLSVKFGINKALSTQCWSETTMVTYLPPAAQPGQVVVTIEDPLTNQKTGSAVFTYLDDTDRQMIELALQIVGLKMNGKLEDARNIARKIIGSDGTGNSNGGSTGTSSQQETPMTGFGNDSFHSLQYGSDEDLILKVINLLPNRPNWSICTPEGQTLLHLSALKGYCRLVSSLLQKGARVDARDVAGYTPLHYASLAGDRTSIELLLNCKARLDAKTDDGLTPEDVADTNVLDLFKYHSSLMSRKFSNSSISSSIFSMDGDQFNIQGGLHVSRMTTDGLTDHCNDDTDEYSSDSSAEASNEESESDDWDDDRGLSLEDLPTAPISAVATRMDGSLWNKVRNVFHSNSDTEDLPRYDELFPLRAKQFTFSKLRFSTATASAEDASSATTANNEVNTSSDESEDVFMKFFNQRKNVQNDKMLLFFWLPLLILIMSVFILHSTGWSFEWTAQFQDFMRTSVSKIMLGNERVKVALNKHFSQGYQAMTSAINA
jgi:ankyrin repeat protein